MDFAFAPNYFRYSSIFFHQPILCIKEEILETHVTCLSLVGFAELKETADGRANIGGPIIGAPIVGQ